MSESSQPSDWSDIRELRREMLRRIGLSLSQDEFKIFKKVLELNVEGRHQKTPRVRKPLLEYVSEIIS